MVRRGASGARYVRVLFCGVCAVTRAALGRAGRRVTVKEGDGRVGIGAARAAGVGEGIVGAQ